MGNLNNTLYGEEIVHGKVCMNCDELKPYTDYAPRGRNKNGEPVDLRNDCKKCVYEKTKVVNELKKIHKYDPETHECLICGRMEKDFGHKYNHAAMCLDHDHVTKEYRGYICMDCNTGLARFQDNPALLYKAAEYLLTGGFQKNYLLNSGSQNVYERLLENI